MRILLAAALLAAPVAARAQQDLSQYNYYGNEPEHPQPQPQPPQQPQRPQPRPQPPPPQQHSDDWRHRVQGLPGQPPPPPRYEARPGPHAAGQIWIPGYWMPRGPQHVWVPGHYAAPPAPGYLWQAPRWENVNGSWVFYEGHWYAGAPPQAMAPYQPPPPSMQDEWAAQPPPPPVREYQPPMPFAGAVWIPGYWHWNGLRFAWVAGLWSPRPPWYFWEPHRWVRSADGRYREEPGHWRR